MTADIRICFVGDSFVNGTGDETALGWAGRLCAAAAKRGVPVTYYNLGVRRNTSKDILMRWEKEVARRLPDTCDGRVVVSCGVNDTVVEDGKVRIRPEASCANLRAILDGARKHKVILVGPPPVDDEQQNERIHSLSNAFAREAELLGVPFIELFSALAANNAYIREISSGDGAHPGSDGYATMAAIISSSPAWWFHGH
jgi:acyl-CoA thioesterase-1